MSGVKIISFQDKSKLEGVSGDIPPTRSSVSPAINISAGKNTLIKNIMERAKGFKTNKG